MDLSTLSYDLSEDQPPTADYSPVIMNNDWPKMTRLCFILFFSCFGTIINGFFIASFFVEKVLKKQGNVFLCCIGFADFIITTFVMPVCAIVLLSGQWENLEVCRALQVMTETSTYSYSILIMLAAGESYLRMWRTLDAYYVYMSMRLHVVIPLIFAGSMALGMTGVYLQLDYDYCQRLHNGNAYYRGFTNILFHGIPWAITLYALLAACILVRQRARRQSYYRRSLQYKRDYSMTSLNFANFLVFVMSWFPYIVILYFMPSIGNPVYYTMTWIALLRSVFTTFFYGMMNRYFRRAYSSIFNYCCCKSNLSPTLNTRNRPGMELAYTRPIASELRVHIMHQALVGQRNAMCETQDL